jgi:hypothetical protein
MNERIRELAEQTKEFMDGSDDLDTFIEKFAELIVRECALTLESITVPVLDYNSDFDNGYNKALLTGVDVIKKHFGVEG